MIKLFIVIAILYFIYNFQNIQENTRREPLVVQERERERERERDITSTRFKRGIPPTNIKYRPENELGVISSDHLIYDH